MLSVLSLLFSLATISQSHEFKLADKGDATPGGLYIRITPPSNWIKSVKSDIVEWNRENNLLVRMSGEVLKSNDHEIQDVLEKTSQTKSSGEDYFLDDTTGAKTGIMKWHSQSDMLNNKMDVIVEMYGVPYTFHLSIYFISNRSNHSLIEQEVISAIKSIKTSGK
jgi:hypothetical protein